LLKEIYVTGKFKKNAKNLACAHIKVFVLRDLPEGQRILILPKPDSLEQNTTTGIIYQTRLNKGHVFHNPLSYSHFIMEIPHAANGQMVIIRNNYWRRRKSREMGEGVRER